MTRPLALDESRLSPGQQVIFENTRIAVVQGHLRVWT
jgi:hypothetical protein